MFGIEDENVFTEFEEGEIKDPSPRKEDADGRITYLSRELGMPRPVGAPVLCDFGSAVLGNEGTQRIFSQTSIVRRKSFLRYRGHTVSTSGTLDAW